MISSGFPLICHPVSLECFYLYHLESSQSLYINFTVNTETFFRDTIYHGLSGQYGFLKYGLLKGSF